jgi:hypothetical protein
MGDEDYSVLDAIRDLLETEQAFFQTIRYLDGNTRNQIAALHMRNTSATLGLLRLYMSNNRTTTMVMNIPLNMNDTFMEPVPVAPTAAQLATATETDVPMTDAQCSICQESIERGTRIRQCGHCFHAECITQWFEMNPRCPMCRHDVRDSALQPAARTSTNDRGLHTNSQ